MENIVSGDYVKYIGEKSTYLTLNKIYKVKSVLKCPICGDVVLELYGFDIDVSYCRFCDYLFLKNCFSKHRFQKV